MAFKATHRFARISARKVRPLADMIRGKQVDEALSLLKYQPQRGAFLLEKVLRSALGNAQDPDQNRETVDVAGLFVSVAKVDGAPMFKRVRPGGRGQSFGILRRSAHIHVELASAGEA